MPISSFEGITLGHYNRRPCDGKQAGKEVGKEVRIARHCLPGVHYMPWIVDTF
jgi:hypothetical protein